MYKEILLPIDLAEPSSWKKALPSAIQICETFGTRLHVMTVVPDFGSSLVGSFFPKGFQETATEEVKKQLKEFVAENIPDHINVQRVVDNGVVYDEILGMSENLDIDLIILSSHRPKLGDYLLGPNAARVVRHAKCSVFVVRD
ncbi:universal stress protein [Terasakiella sp. A23]|uniref:universal stress protein n=1 Tax=Terasakiella sp. FCG-A23 TaxID=3080561 RepID=UPI002954D280|nr:universal stress protein [Terasakiella sp. A23]MDV7341197.1 universal stress protein [Terasakiella sp. A23]